MKSLSVRQPFAEEIASGRKTAEFRTWRTHYRGPLLICACARKHAQLPVGVAIAIADLVDITPDGEAWAWQLQNVRRVKPFPVRGALGLFDVPDESLV